MSDTPEFSQQNQTVDRQTNIGTVQGDLNSRQAGRDIVHGDVHYHAPETPPPLAPTFRAFLSKLPVSGQYLFDRDTELAALDTAWQDENTQIFSLIAWGGEGKTALTNRWLDNLKKLGSHARRGLASYEAWLKNSTQTAQVAQKAQSFWNPLRLLRRSRPLRSDLLSPENGASAQSPTWLLLRPGSKPDNAKPDRS